MRVLFISCCMTDGGAGRSLWDLIKSVEGEVEPYVLFAQKCSTYDSFVEKGVKCFVHPFVGIVKKSSHGTLHLLLHPWRTYFGKWLRYDLPCLFFVRKLIRKEKIDLVHTNLFAFTLGWSIQHFLHVKHVWHIREYAESAFLGGEIAGGRKRLTRKMNSADARIVSSKTCLDFWNFKKENTWAILDAVRSIDDCCYEKDKQPYILFCSNWISEAKGAFKAVRSFGLSGLAKEGIRLRFIGKRQDSIQDALLSLAKEYDCADAIDFLPFQKDVKPHFQFASVFLQLSPHEGMGRTLAEAMFYGCPVVALASGGTLDLVRHGETGWLFHTEEECADLLRTVCTTDQERIILNAQDFAKSNLSIENYGPKVLAVYEAVLGVENG